MLGLFKPPIETRLLTAIWPRPDDTVMALCRSGDRLTGPPTAIQLTTATANLAIATHHLTDLLPVSKTRQIEDDLRHRMFLQVAGADTPCRVSTLLKLEEERQEWQRITGLSADCWCGLNTILQVVHTVRMRHYHAAMAQARRAALSGEFHGYGPMGFIAKRWLSQLSGQVIVHEDDLSEEGFPELGVASLYFTYKAKELSSTVGRD